MKKYLDYAGLETVLSTLLRTIQETYYSQEEVEEIVQKAINDFATQIGLRVTDENGIVTTKTIDDLFVSEKELQISGTGTAEGDVTVTYKDQQFDIQGDMDSIGDGDIAKLFESGVLTPSN